MPRPIAPALFIHPKSNGAQSWFPEDAPPNRAGTWPRRISNKGPVRPHWTKRMGLSSAGDKGSNSMGDGSSGCSSCAGSGVAGYCSHAPAAWEARAARVTPAPATRMPPAPAASAPPRLHFRFPNITHPWDWNVRIEVPISLSQSSPISLSLYPNVG
jgi:hypothetical protein